MQDEYLIRVPGPADAAELGAAHVRIWNHAYEGLLDADRLADVNAEDRAERWRAIIAGQDEQARRGVVTRCAVHAPTGRIAGFASGGRARDGDAPAPTELWALNVLPEHHGTGLAGRLVRSVLGDAPGATYLWVLRGNERAIAFYRRLGFVQDGRVKFDDHWQCHEERMLADAVVFR